MLMTRKMRKYLVGKLDELTEEEIKHCQWILHIHRIQPIKIAASEDGEEYSYEE